MIGAGETGELTARALRASGVQTVFVANRRYDRAIGLAQRFGGSAVRFDDLPAELARADIVVSSTASPHQILDRDDLELTMEQRPDRPLVLIDIAVPRDVEPGARDIPGVALYDMDDLQRAAARGRSVREAEAARARSLVEEEVSASTAGWPAWTWCPPSPRCASGARRWCRPCCARTSSAGSRSPTPTASGWR